MDMSADNLKKNRATIVALCVDGLQLSGSEHADATLILYAYRDVMSNKFSQERYNILNRGVKKSETFA